MDRLSAAHAGLAAAFMNARSEVLASLEQHRHDAVPDTSEEVSVRVPRRPILDGEWQQFIPQFEAAGRKAAHMAVPIGSVVSLIEPDLGMGADNDDLSWLVLVSSE